MLPWELIDSAPTPDNRGTLSLHRRGDEYVIRIDGRELMSSRMHGSERAMARLALAELSEAEAPRVLVGGLGMGFTLAEANGCLPKSAIIEVAELVHQVVLWNQGPLGALARHPLKDRRVQVRQGDIRALISEQHEAYDAILLDIDNGPHGLTQASNRSLYGNRGLSELSFALKPGGTLAVWSAFEASSFTKRLRGAGLNVAVHHVSARGEGGGPKHVVWVARTAAQPKGSRPRPHQGTAPSRNRGPTGGPAKRRR